MKFNKKSLFLFALLGIFLISFVSAFSFGDFFNNVFGKMTGNVIADSSKVLNIDFDVLENISPKNGPAVVGNSGDYWNPIHPSKGYSLYRNSPAQDNNRSGFKYADGGRSSVVIRMINLAGGYTGNYGVNKDPMLSTINYQYDLERGNNGLPSYIYIYNLSVGNYDLYLYGPLGIYEVLIPDGYGRPQSYGIKNNTQNSQLLASTNKWTEGINYQVYSNLKISHFSDYLAINLIPSPGSPYHDTEISGLQLVPAGTRLAIGNVTPTIICNSAADCPQVTGTSSPYCSGSSLCTNDVSATCVSPGTVNSYCTTSNGASCVVCAQGCANNACINVQTNQTNTTATCIDSDGGLNYNVKGNVTFGSCTYGYNSGGCGGSSISDSCLGNTSANPGYLRETYCTANNSATFIDYQCPNGCALGACLPVQNQTNTTATCIDSDGGLNY
ncbi:MAG: hypothetical protein WCK29_02370, partial [archaeon]